MKNDNSPTVLSMEHKAMQETRPGRRAGWTDGESRLAGHARAFHVCREEEFAMPPLLLLGRLALGESRPTWKASSRRRKS